MDDLVVTAHDALERVFVRTPDGWERRPPNPNRFFDIKTGGDETADPLATLRQISRARGVRLCRPPGEAGMFATGRAGLERHVGRSPLCIRTSASKRSSRLTA